MVGTVVDWFDGGLVEGFGIGEVVDNLRYLQVVACFAFDGC